MKVGEIWKQKPSEWDGESGRVRIIRLYTSMDYTEMVGLEAIDSELFRKKQYPSYQRELFIQYFEKDYDESR